MIYPTSATLPETLYLIDQQIQTKFQSLRPKQNELLSQWATQNFYLSKDYAEDFGLYSYSERPYQKEILDEIGKPENMECVILGGTQVIKTIAIMIFMAYMIANDPGPSLYVTTSKVKGGEFSRTRLKPMIRDNSFLSERMEKTSLKMTDAILMKAFVNGWLAIAGSNSLSDFISSTLQYLMLDEIDAWKIPREESGGDQLDLLLKRITEYRKHKIIYTSSPGIKGQSRIIPKFEASDQRFLYVPCPSCGHFQQLKWGGPKFDYGFKWINNDPSTVYYLCENPECKEHILESEKYFMLTHYEFRKHKPEVKNKPGWFVPRLYSSTSAWGSWVEEFLIAKSKVKEGDKTKLQVFINTTLAELWDPTYGLPEEEELLQRVENYYSGDHPTLPEKICTLTAFTDVQDSYLETLIMGWGIGEENWIIERHIMPGNPGQQYVWNELDILLQKPFMHSLGVPLLISAAGVDTGGHFTDEAYSFVKNKSHRRIYGTKGANIPGKPIAPKQPSMNNKGGIPLYIIGTDTAKEVVYGRLQIEKKPDWKDDEVHPGYPHFNHYCDSDFFEQLTGEKQVMRKINGLSVPVWEEISTRRHEVLDCAVGNLAVLRISKQNLLKITEDLKNKSTQLKQGTLFDQPKAETKQQQPIKKNWTNNW